MALSTQQASNLYNSQQASTRQTLADILAQGDALKGDAQGRINGGSQGYYTGGTSGYYADNRPQVNTQYNTIRDDVANVFNQAIAAIQAQAPQIQQNTADKQAVFANLVNAQNSAASQASAQQVGDQQRAAAAMGIDAAPQTSRASGTAAALSANRNAGAGLQRDFFGAIGQTALGRNEAQAGAFGYANSEQQKAIEAARQAALAKAVYWVPGSRGSYVSTYGKADKASDKSLISGINKTQKAIQASTASEAKQRAKDPSIRQGAIQANRRLT